MDIWQWTGGQSEGQININIITVILRKDIQAAHKGGFLFHKSPSRAMARSAIAYFATTRINPLSFDDVSP